MRLVPGAKERQKQADVATQRERYAWEVANRMSPTRRSAAALVCAAIAIAQLLRSDNMQPAIVEGF
ncbi:MAG: hypothetical protein C5B46_00550 [Proteobacteria bacterium]|nr:MAG: hypothetical protein C5B46_00550 [Pseudomonadota bacterium]